MTKRDELLALAERCEKASGPDRMLDLDIFRAIGAPLPSEFMSRKVEWDEVDLCFVMLIDTMRVRYEPPPFTTSLDAARSLGGLCVFASDIAADGLPMVKIVADTSKIPVAEHTGIARTLELAWCAAALRARAEMGS